MHAAQLFQTMLRQASVMVSAIEPRHLAIPTANLQWDIGDLLTHMRRDLACFVHEPEDWQAGWEELSAKAQIAAQQPTADKELLHDLATELMILCWDLGQALQCHVLFAPEIERAVYDRLAARQTADDVASAEQPLQVKLLALFGRQRQTVT